MSTRIESCIKNAIATNKAITIKYRKYDGSISERKISEIEYSSEYGNEYIYAYCHLRKDYRTFKISRILDIVDNKVTPIKTISTGHRVTTNYSSLRQFPNTSSYYYENNNNTNNSQSDGCYIATMVYGDYNHPQVLALRKFRDARLKKSFIGRLFIKFYYSVSPKIVQILSGHDSINKTIRHFLDAFVKLLMSSR